MAPVRFEIAPGWTGRAIPSALWPDLERRLNDIGQEVAITATHLVPIDTGALRMTIRVEHSRGINGPTVEVVAGAGHADYASYVEHGTSRMAAQPYLGPALEQAARLGRF